MGNIQGCHGNCSGGLYVCTMVKRTSIMQIKPKDDLFPEAIFAGLLI